MRMLPYTIGFVLYALALVHHPVHAQDAQGFPSDPPLDADIAADFERRAGRAQATATQPDGKIIVTGTARPDDGTGSAVALARYRPDGSLDTTFGTDGLVVTRFATRFAEAGAVALQADGRIVVAGTADVGTGDSNFALARFRPDGTPDASFGTDGEAIIDFADADDAAHALAIQPDGKIIAAGYSDGGSLFGNTRYDVALARLNPDGSLDRAFGTDNRVVDGKVTTDFNARNDVALAVVLQDNGMIVVHGYTTESTFARPKIVKLARYHPDGSLDTRFATFP